MKSHKRRVDNTMMQLSEKERKEVFKWIDNLSIEEIEKLELITKVQLAEELTTVFLKYKKKLGQKNAQK